MLVHWQSHQEYLYFLHETKVHLDSSQRMRLHLEFDAAREKLRMLNLDPVMEYLSAFYSHTGRPAVNQPQILRSLVLMMLLGVTSLTAWCQRLRADSLLALLIGCRPNSLPPLGSYFDLMDRLWSQPKALQKTGRKDLFPKDKNSKPSNKPGKGKKLPNKHPGITGKLAAYALSHESFPFHYEEPLQQLFRLAALIPSLRDGLFPTDGVTLSGDGTCVHSHASSLHPIALPFQLCDSFLSQPPVRMALVQAEFLQASISLLQELFFQALHRRLMRLFPPLLFRLCLQLLHIRGMHHPNAAADILQILHQVTGLPALCPDVQHLDGKFLSIAFGTEQLAGILQSVLCMIWAFSLKGGKNISESNA